MKKFFSVFLLLALFLTLAGCGNHSDLPENPPSHGTVSGLSYKSEYTGLCFTVNSDKWVFSSDKELAAGCGIDPDLYTSSDFSEVLRNNKTVYDMMATSEAHHMSIVTGFENLTLAEEDPNMSAKDYVTKMIEAFSEGLTQENPYEVSDTKNVTLCGHTYARKILKVSGEDSWGGDYSLSQAYYARNLGGYMSVTLVFFPNTVTIEQVESLFY